MWQLVLPQLLTYIEKEDHELKEDLLNAARLDDPQGYDTLVTTLASTRFCNHMTEFVLSKEKHVNFQYWWQYMNMVCILLMFFGAQLEGRWELHLYAFREMLPYLIGMIVPTMPEGVVCT